MDGLTTSDVLAMRDDNSGFDGGVWLWVILIVLFLGGFGNGNRNDNFIADEFTQRDIFANQTATLTSSAENLKATMQAGYDNALATMQSSYQTLLGFKDAQYQQSQCCCEIKTQMAEQTNALANAIHNEGETTRALITNNRISELEYQLNNANTIISNQVQSQNLLNALGSYMPYGAYNYGCGCGCNNL